METITVKELKKLLNNLSDDTKIYLSSDEEGNQYGAISMKFGTAVYEKDKALILYPHGYVEFEDIAPIASQEEEDGEL